MNPIRVAAVQAHATHLAGFYAKTPPDCYAAMMWKWGGDRSLACRSKLFRSLMLYTAAISRDEGWTDRAGGIQERLVVTAIKEMAHPFPHGTDRDLREGFQADECQVPRRQWKVWRKRYNAIYDELNDWANQAWRICWKNQAID